MRLISLVTIGAAMLVCSPAAHAQSSDTRPLDPAILAYTTVVKDLDLDMPLDRRLVTGFVDQLVSTIEGVAIGHGVKNDRFFADLRKQRLALRQFFDLPLDTPRRSEQGKRLFHSVALLVRDVDSVMGSNPNAKEAIEAVERSARSLDTDDPLRWQPDNIENFLKLAGEALTRMHDARSPR